MKQKLYNLTRVLLVAAILMPLSLLLPAGKTALAAVTVSCPVSVVGDDSYASSNGPTFHVNTGLTLFGDSAPWDSQYTMNVNVPQGAKIAYAYIRGTSSGNYASDNVSVSIRVNDVDNATAPNDYASFVAQEGTTTGNISWSNIEHFTIGNFYNTPSLTSLVQNIVDRPGWVSGNKMQFFFENNNSTIGSGIIRGFYDTSSGQDRVTLYVTYSVGSGWPVTIGSDDANGYNGGGFSTVGTTGDTGNVGGHYWSSSFIFRSANFSAISNNATISNAYISVTSGANSTGGTPIEVGVYCPTGTYDLSTFTGQAEWWTRVNQVNYEVWTVPAFTYGHVYDSVDISAEITSVIHQSYWPSVNTTGFLITLTPHGVFAPNTGINVDMFESLQPATLTVLYNNDATSPTITTLSTSNVSMTKDGVISGNFSGNITSVGDLSLNGWFDYGLTPSYGSTTSNVSYNSTGIIYASMPANLTPGQTYHYRFSATNSANTTYGSDANFTLTMPTVITNPLVDIGGGLTSFNGTITNMGVASSAYVSFEWGYDLNYGHTTVEATANTPLTFTDAIAPSQIKPLHYRARARVGSTYSYGADQTLGRNTNVDTVLYFILPLGLLIILIFVMKSVQEGGMELSPVLIISLIAVVAAIIEMLANAFVGF